MGGGILKHKNPIELKINEYCNMKQKKSKEFESFIIKSKKFNNRNNNMKRKVDNPLANMIRSTENSSENLVGAENFQYESEKLSSNSSGHILEIVDEIGNVKVYRLHSTVYH